MSRFLAPWLLSFALAACAGDPGDLQAWLARERARPAPPPPALPLPADFEPPPPAAALARDPFAPPAPPAAAGGRVREPLERYALDSLAMVGTLGRGERREALVRDPDGGIHRVGRGAHLGRDEGRVVAVGERRLDLRERVPDGRAGWLERSAGLSLAGP